jgi:hypothetical protein
MTLLPVREKHWLRPDYESLSSRNRPNSSDRGDRALEKAPEVDAIEHGVEPWG